ncbi:hypothetical protein [Trichormus sp. NMC-1]|uniref:hypothetical protein n=1 Tax=Trichormus sp. NMC-1 TaxID=1853259 RepID=UPI0008DC2B18|nr:hypothetical protein [Trichormus sp. NMC-1]
MKINKKRHNDVFPQVSKWTGYILGLVAAFIIVVQQNPQGIHLFALIELFFQAAHVERVNQKDDNHSDKSN